MDFLFYAERGIGHVFDLNYPSHLLYFTAVAIGFAYREWQQIAGVSIVFFSTFFCSLFLSAYDAYDSAVWLVNALLPICILLAALCNYMYFSYDYFDYDAANLILHLHFVVAFISGFIQGLSFYQRFAMSMFMKESRLGEVLGLTVGAQLGQIVITIAVFIIASFFSKKLQVRRLTFIAVCSAVIIAIALPMINEAMYP